MTADKAPLLSQLGYQFKNASLLDEALTHSSAVRAAPNSERLEFLGDRVLGLAMADWLYEAYPDAAEGKLAAYFAALVGRESLAKVARTLDLGTYLNRAKGDQQSERGEDTMLADAMEAVLAAVYLDGGMAPAVQIVRQLFADAVVAQANAPRDPKSALQEWAQAKGHPLPSYSLISRSGPSHAPLFEIEVSVKGTDAVRATGASKQEAEKAAAAALLNQLG